MDRCVILVDAGYLYAEGGKLCYGTPSRLQSVLQPFLAVELLQKVALDITQLPVLRIYWYDAARNGIRTQEQREVAGLPNVKLRLGRLNSHNQQKGVDALIYRDLITLAQHRVISDAVLLSGDEDLREGVRAAQDYGVRVVLVGIDHAVGWSNNQSEELILEADHHVVLVKSQLESMFKRRSSAMTQKLPPHPFSMEGESGEEPAAGTSARRAAATFAREWLKTATETEIAKLHAGRPRIPRPLDVELIASVEQAMNQTLIEDDMTRQAVRSAFWGVIGKAVSSRTPKH